DGQQHPVRQDEPLWTIDPRVVVVQPTATRPLLRDVREPTLVDADAGPDERQPQPGGDDGGTAYRSDGKRGRVGRPAKHRRRPYPTGLEAVLQTRGVNSG